jgi:hypothetical protein
MAEDAVTIRCSKSERSIEYYGPELQLADDPGGDKTS